MPDPNRPSGAENAIEKTAEKSLASRSDAVELVYVQVAILKELQEMLERLDGYVRGYISARKLAAECMNIEARLELGRKETHRLGDRDFWNVNRDYLNRASEVLLTFPDLIRIEYQQLTEILEGKFKDLDNVMAGPARSPAGADVMNISDQALRSIKEILDSAKPITVQSEQRANEALRKVETVIARIFDRIPDKRIQEFYEQQMGESSFAAKERMRPADQGSDTRSHKEGKATPPKATPTDAVSTHGA